MPRWRAYDSLVWFIGIGLAVAAFLALVVAATVIFAGGTHKYPGSSPQVFLDQAPCDVDWDGDCDGRDYSLALRSLGKCLGDVFYQRGADIDRDDCVTKEDLQKAWSERFPAPLVSPVTGDTSGWQTYRNEEVGFAIDYPAGWTLREGEKGPIFFLQVLKDRDGVTVIPGGEIGFTPPDDLAYDDTLAGRPAGVVEWGVGGDYAHKFIYFQEPAGFYLQLSHQLLAGEEFRGASPVLEEILSTFRFIK